MKRYLMMSMVVLALALSVSVRAADEDTDEDVSGTLTGRRESPWGSTSANVALTTDYTFRGISQTDHQPAIQGGLDWTHPIGFYLGAWGSNVKYTDNPATVEVDASAGYTLSLPHRVDVSLGAVYYTYFRGSSANMWEFPIEVERKPFRAGVAASPNYGGQYGTSLYVSAGWNDSYFWKVKLGLNAGYTFFAPTAGLLNYADFHVSVGREFLSVLWDVSGYMVDKRQFNGLDSTRVVFTASKTF